MVWGLYRKAVLGSWSSGPWPFPPLALAAARVVTILTLPVPGSPDRLQLMLASCQLRFWERTGRE